MLFRIWYHAGQIALLGFALAAAGAMFNRTGFLLPIGVSLIVPLGIIGAILGIVWCMLGIRTACPRCGTRADWVSPAKSVIAVDCEQCGLVGGNPAWDWQPRTLEEYDESSTDAEEDDEPVK